MNSEADIRIGTRISTTELERRWKAVRMQMKERGLDFLVLQNCTDSLGGYLKWFTDLPTRNNYPATVIFPRDDEMITIWHGPRPPAEPSPPAWSIRGVKKRISVPYVPTLGKSSGTFDAEKVVEELAQYKNCNVGLVGTELMSAAFYKCIVEQLNTAKFEDATNMVDAIKAIKSDEEIQLTREVCEMQDSIFEYALTRIQPGKRDYEIHADIVHRCLEMGGEQTNIMVGSAAANVASKQLPLHFWNRRIEEGDQFTLLIEANGPSGLWAELGRTICLGKASLELEEQCELAIKAQKLTLSLLKPGADPAAIFKANNDFMKSIGYPEEKRIFAHGMGYDMVERPAIDCGETMKIAARMNIAVHPSVVSAKAAGWVCENYIIAETGENECLHKTVQKIFEI